MRERIEQVGGHLAVTGGRRGATVRAVVPLASGSSAKLMPRQQSDASPASNCGVKSRQQTTDRHDTRTARIGVAVARAAGPLIVTLLFTMSGPVGVTSAATTDPDSSLGAMDDPAVAPDLLAISNELIDSGLALRELQIALQTADDAVASSQAASTAAARRSDDLAGGQARTQASIAAAEAELRDLAARKAATRARLATLARDPYVSSELDPLRLLVDITSLDEYSDRIRFARIARLAHDAELARAVEQESTLRATVAGLRRHADAIETLQASARKKAILAGATNLAAVTAQSELEALVADQAATVEAFGAARRQEEERLAELSANSATLAQQLAQLSREDSYQGAPPSARAVMAYPVDGRISSPFGNRLHPILNYVRLHTGIDFAAACGTPVRAAADGVIVSAGWAGGYGNQVVISHGRVAGVSVATTYNHLSEFAVTSGEVRQGDIIAYVGTTGLSTGCHLHFETREAGTPVDPLNWLR